MRTPDDLPRRRREKRSSVGSGGGRRGRILLALGVAVALFLLLSLRGIAGFYTDYLWFDSLGQTAVWRGLLGARGFLSALFILLFFGMAWANFYVADRLAPPFRPAGPEDELLERYHELVAGRMHWVRLAVAGFLAFIAGVGAGGEWNSWILFRNSQDFGLEDPQFGYDIGFYVFRLPFLAFVVDWFFASLLIILIITAVSHYLNGGIRVQTQAPRVSPQVKAHLSLLLAALAIIRAFDYYLQRFELTVSGRGVVDGMSHTDANAQLPALNLLVLISVFAAGLFIYNIFRRGWTLPVVAVALWGFVAVVVGGIYPAYVQRFQVEPNESEREAVLMERNMDATRYAMGLCPAGADGDEDSMCGDEENGREDIRTEPYSPRATPASEVDLSGYEPTMRNVRLWDPSDAIALRSYEEHQRFRDYYHFTDIDVDRYQIDGEMTTVGIGLRQLDYDEVPISGWEGRHLAYTHGYGVVAAPSGATDERDPEFLIQDIPERFTTPDLEVAQPRTYFGEDLSGYAMTGSSRDEIDYATENDTEITPYDGEDGVGAGSLFRRIAFALRFGDLNPIISGFMGGDTKVHYVRDVSERIENLAPFLHADADPYPVLLEDRTVWVQDLYTTTDGFPYGQKANVDELSGDSGLRHDFNYVRNSVKATVDAYDGTVEFFVVDDEDPIVNAYRQAFPDLFTDGADMPSDLQDHLRYPEDLFRAQTIAWQRYHLDQVDEFFSQDDAWRVSIDPGTVGAEGVTPVTDASGEVTDVLEARIPPYYQALQLPGESELEFALLRPFNPFSEDDRRQQLRALMVARMDPENYGELVVYEMPSGDMPDGPGIVQADIRSDRFVAETETLLGGAGTQVHFGNLILLPLGDRVDFVDDDGYLVDSTGARLEDADGNNIRVNEEGALLNDAEEELRVVEGEVIDQAEDPVLDSEGDPLVTNIPVGEDNLPEFNDAGEIPAGGLAGELIYAQPFYVEPEDRNLPRLRQVIVAYGDSVVIEGTLQDALEEMFGEQVETAEDPEIVGEEDPELEDREGADPEAEGEGEGEGEGEEPADEPAEEEPEAEEPPATDADREQLWDDATAAMSEASEALEEGDLGTFQEKFEEALNLAQQAQSATEDDEPEEA
jgi:hypothetical protein